MTAATDALWTVHIATAGSTVIQLCCAPRDDHDPWLLSRAVNDLLALGAERDGRPHAAGSGRGQPLLHTQSFLWQGCTVELLARHLRDGAGDEVQLTLPAWDELTDVVDDETLVWQMCDVVAAACEARWGAIDDSESLIATLSEDAAAFGAMLRRHPGLLVPENIASALPRAACDVHRLLPESGLAVVLR